MNGADSILAEAQCGVHPGRAALTCCSRCGSYACPMCVAIADPPWCVACRERFLTASPRLRVLQSFAAGWRLFGAAFGALSGLAAAFAALGLAVTFALTFISARFPAVTTVWEVVSTFTVDLVASLSALLAISAARFGRRLPVKEAIGRALQLWHRVVRPYLRAWLLVAAFTLLLVVPGVVKFLDYSLVYCTAVFEPGDPLQRSRELVAGQRWPMLGLVVLLVVGAVVAGVLLGLLQTLPLPSGETSVKLGMRFATSWVVALLGFLADAIFLAAYLELRQRQALVASRQPSTNAA